MNISFVAKVIRIHGVFSSTPQPSVRILRINSNIRVDDSKFAQFSTLSEPRPVNCNSNGSVFSGSWLQAIWLQNSTYECCVRLG